MSIDEIRAAYQVASKQPEYFRQLDQYLSPERTQQEPLLLAYKGAIEGIRADQALFPLEKLALLQQAQSYFDKAVKAAPDEVEIRFLRFTIEHNIPTLLMLSVHLEQDLRFIIKNLGQSPLQEDLKRRISKFLLDSGRCTFKDKQTLAPYLS
ncbi:hypothetical protein [Eisenibacter elegans]|uniref:hypothetical protein n=1 Tax=Eisenibacter elegans TaxID=997 RepID=UPI000406AC89|nr:hypothetical protein [Eisenibacter elegans]